MSDLAASVGPGLLQRFRSAGGEIQWREAPTPSKPRRGAAPAERVRIAHLHDEESRIVDRPDGSIVVESGPVGALVLLLEIDRRGAPTALEAKAAGALPGFGQGAIEARWGIGAAGPGLPLADVVGLARYALV
jgi:hypothetical protein